MIFSVIKIFPLLIYAGILSIFYKSKTLEENYFKARQLSKKVLDWLGYNLKVSGVENIKDKTYLFLCNHQGTIDPAIIVAGCPKPISFISKKENEKIFVLGQWAKNIKTIHFDRETREGNISMIKTSLRYFKEGKSLLIFPEGTRSKKDEMNEFKKNSLQLAYLGRVDIIPVTLNNAYCLDVNSKCKTVSIDFNEVIKYEDYKDLPYDQLSEIVFDKIKSKIKTK